MASCLARKFKIILISLDLGQKSTSKHYNDYQDIQSKIDDVKEEENVPKEPKEPKASKGPKVHPKDPKPILKKTIFTELRIMTTVRPLKYW